MRLLVILSVLLCTLQFCEPASAQSADRDVIVHFDQGESDSNPQEPTGKFAHSGHHHCPVAPDPRQATSEPAAPYGRGPLFAAAVAQLPSRVLPPLLDPPLG